MSMLAESPPLVPRRTRRAASRTGLERAIRVFFGGNALVALIVLALITIFLAREGFGFFGQNLANLRLYRQAGLEYVDIIRAETQKHAALSRSLSQVRLRQFRASTLKGASAEEANAALADFDAFASAFSDSATELNGLVSDSTDTATALKEQLASEAAAGGPATVNRAAALQVLTAATGVYDTTVAALQPTLAQLVERTPALPDPAAQKMLVRWQQEVRDYAAGLPAAGDRLRTWSPDVPVPWYRAISSFLFGHDWITASFWQDWYGIRPLLVGSIMVSSVALALAVPLGVSSAIYVSEIATKHEKRIIKPYIEFISAIPSVVLGFFGIAVVGQAVRAFSQLPMVSWVSFFPISERLNVFTAGSLLALMAVPTIFTLAEDALRNVPRGFKEASYALGANRLQTILRVLVPASLSGIVSAILLGLGRVIGETMVVLLCAGNRIEIPDFSEGLGAFFQPVHTMTGIIAQEMGEVVRGSIHYRALFMVGLVLFTITLVINYLAQKLVARYRMSIG
ncbi:MAG: phosphate ABC transporter permease subunit PstC [Verrucomicrobiota bacterium]|nr:phosphate ABC transporter permease subunit PstC [Verrucomicrobiota bacterium]